MIAVLALSFTSCSDDDEDKVDGLIEIKSFGVKVENNQFIFSWIGLADAHSYTVHYKAEGATEWEQTNAYVPATNNKPGELMSHTMMGGFVKGVKYDMYMTAKRGTVNNDFAKSAQITSPEIPINDMIGTWISYKNEIIIDAKTNNDLLTEALVKELIDDTYTDVTITFDNDYTYQATSWNETNEGAYEYAYGTLILKGEESDQEDLIMTVANNSFSNVNDYTKYKDDLHYRISRIIANDERFKDLDINTVVVEKMTATQVFSKQ